MSNDDEVGYARPPKKTQFKPGQSGNPKGRPKGTKNLRTDLAEELREQVFVTEGGKRQPVSKQRALVKSLTAKAVQGDARSVHILVNLVLRLFEQQDEIDKGADLSGEDLAILRNYESRIRKRLNSTNKESKNE